MVFSLQLPCHLKQSRPSRCSVGTLRCREATEVFVGMRDYPEQCIARHLTRMRSLQHSDKAGKLAKVGMRVVTTG